MKIKDILASARTISFEFFPPKNAEGIPAVFRAVGRLTAFQPDFVSVTYGAGGTTRGFTEEITRGLKERYDTEVMAHLTCVGQTRAELNQVLERLDYSMPNSLAAVSSSAKASSLRSKSGGSLAPHNEVNRRIWGALRMGRMPVLSALDRAHADRKSVVCTI